ncbi:MAG TPA: Fe-S cluster assembly ATPase SufC [Candidatus Omnitrophota bacterium]|nr:Fe-S cluster assembly ATPase SufC [Candidatus Omnitrophota bacterium]
MTLEIKNLNAGLVKENRKILNGVNLKLEKGKVYALMGPNGSGKTSLSNVLMGNPKYRINSGEILLDNVDIAELSPDEKAKKGLFLSFQQPTEIPGVIFSDFLRMAYNSLTSPKKSFLEFNKMLKEKAKLLDIDESFLNRYLNEGFSGGEKKKSEILQMLILNPSVVVLDETDSGLDIDSLRTISRGIKNFAGSDKIILVITHYKRILEYIKPDKVFVMMDGRIVAEENGDFVNHLEEKGYAWLKEENKQEENNEE